MNDYRIIIENMYEGVYYVDRNRKIILWNHGAERITGFSASEVMNSHCYNNILNHQDDFGNKLCFGGCPLHQTIQDGKIRESYVYLHHKNGHRIPVKVKTFAIIENGEIIGAAEVFTDDIENTSIVHDMEVLKKLAMYDQLTDLPNRRYLENHLNSNFLEYKTIGIKFGIVFIDIDDFKNINDTYGHDVGDEVLKMISDSLKSSIRSSDIIGRWGGEEFVAIFSGIELEGFIKASEKMRRFVEMSSLRKGSEEISVTISLGGVLIKENDNVESVIKQADDLMYISKSKGKNISTIQ